MRTKNYINLSLITLFAIAFVGLAGCKEDGVNPDQNNFDLYKDVITYDFDDAMNDIQNASFDGPMRFNDFFNSPEFPRHGFYNDGGHRHPPRHDRGFHLRRIIERLSLSEDQRGELQLIFGEYRECLVPALEMFREAAREYLEAANLERREIINRVHNGEITREEARELIHQLNMETRELIENDPDCIAAREAMCECKVTFFDAFEEILNEDQLVIWNEWLQNHNDPCL